MFYLMLRSILHMHLPICISNPKTIHISIIRSLPELFLSLGTPLDFVCGIEMVLEPPEKIDN
jgi:hypothetical protein